MAFYKSHGLYHEDENILMKKSSSERRGINRQSHNGKGASHSASTCLTECLKTGSDCSCLPIRVTSFGLNAFNAP